VEEGSIQKVYANIDENGRKVKQEFERVGGKKKRKKSVVRRCLEKSPRIKRRFIVI